MPGRDLYGRLFRHVIYPAYEGGLRRRNTPAYMDEYARSQWLSRDELQDLQWRKLRALIEHCWEHVPYYRARWRAEGIGSADEIRGFEDYARLPVLTKNEVREHCTQLAARTHRDRILYKTTGGSTGEPLQVGYTRESYERRVAVMFRGYDWAGAGPGRRTLYLWGSLPGGSTWRDRLQHLAFNRRFLDAYSMSEHNLGDYADAIDRHRPEAIVSYVAPLVRVARWLRERKRTPWSPGSILCAAEPLHAHQRELLEEVFGCPVYNTYGCREFMLVASQCEHRGSLHVNADHLRVELGPPLQGHGRHSPSEVLVTDLHNYGMPLLRYANGDIATGDDGNCPCGRGLPLLATVDGRSMDVLRSPSGHFVGEYLEYLIFQTAGIRRFQAVQHRLDEIELALVRGPELQDSSLELIRERMRAAYGDSLRLVYSYRDEIPLTPTGKLRVAISTLSSSVSAMVADASGVAAELGLERLVIAAC